MSNMLSYCGLVDAKIRASDKDLPVDGSKTNRTNSTNLPRQLLGNSTRPILYTSKFRNDPNQYPNDPRFKKEVDKRIYFLVTLFFIIHFFAVIPWCTIHAIYSYV